MNNLTLTDPRVIQEARAYAELGQHKDLVAVFDHVLKQVSSNFISQTKKCETKVVELEAIKLSNKCKIKKCLVNGEESIVKINSDAKVTKNEIQNLTQLKHKSVVQLRNVLSRGGQIALVLELGRPVQLSLSSELNTRESQLKPIMRQILEGIAYIHSKGYVHGDIKPANMICVSDQAKIIDFGGGIKIVSGSCYHFQYTTMYLAIGKFH
jgi:serine/threonine protein kinase